MKPGALSQEQVVGSTINSHFVNLKSHVEQTLKNPANQMQGADFEIATWNAYLEKTRNGDFFTKIEIPGTYDGVPGPSAEGISVYDYFKGISGLDFNDPLIKAGNNTEGDKNKAIQIVDYLDSIKK